MATRDEEEFEKKRQQIMEGALQVFSEKGFEKATNRDIARAAGIGSTGLIYHYFKDKTDLLRQAVMANSPALRVLAEDRLPPDMPLRKALTMIGAGFVGALADPANTAIFRVVLGESVRQGAMGDAWNSIGPTPAFRTLSRYFSAQMDAGHLRRMDVGVAVRSFLGPFILYVLSRHVFPQADLETLTADLMVQTGVEIFLHGMAIGEDSARQDDAK